MEKNSNADSEIFPKALNHAFYFLKFRSRSEKEVRLNLEKYLKKLKLQQSDILKLVDAVIVRLKDLKFIDDFDFVRFWFEKRTKINPKGLRLIRFELLQKGISKEIVEQRLEQLTKNNPQKETIFNLIEKAAKKYSALKPFAKKQKICRYLLSRGFEYQEIESVIDEFLKKQ